MLTSVTNSSIPGSFRSYKESYRASEALPNNAALAETVVLGQPSTKDLEPSPAFRQLTEWMGDEFSSARQASEDPSRFEVDLGIRPIWDELADNKTQYYYVEQAIAGDQPYRQRVYRVSEESENRFVSEIFELPNPERFIGADGDNPIFDTFRPEHLIERDGCDVILKRDSDGHFRGSTEGSRCSSTYNGADYTVSIVDVGPEGLATLDQGYLQDGTKVWGANTPYRFDRK
jgi:hypothetical protein